MPFEPGHVITAERLKRLAGGHQAKHAADVAPFLAEYAEEFGIRTPLRCAHLLAQLCHESGYFDHMVENLSYSADRIREIFPRLAGRADELARNPEKLANAAYANKLGNGDEKSGDGWFYRGRGLIQLTGRENYRTMALALERDLSADPAQAAKPGNAVRIALTFWKSRNCNEAADSDSVEKVTRLINGGLNGLEDRKRLTESAKRIFIETTDLIS